MDVLVVVALKCPFPFKQIHIELCFADIDADVYGGVSFGHRVLTLATFGLLRPIRLFELIDETVYRCTLVNGLSCSWSLRCIELVHR